MKFFFLLVVLVTLPATTYAQNFLVGIPGVEQGASGSFDAYIQAVYVMFISIAALLAVVKIIIAGLKYMFTDIVTQKGEAKKDIQGALFGLLIVMSAVLILTVINPELTSFNPDISQVATPEAQRDAQGNIILARVADNQTIPANDVDAVAVFIQGCRAEEGRTIRSETNNETAAEILVCVPAPTAAEEICASDAGCLRVTCSRGSWIGGFSGSDCLVSCGSRGGVLEERNLWMSDVCTYPADFDETGYVTLDEIIADPNDPRFGTTPITLPCDLAGTDTCEQITENCLANANYVTTTAFGPNQVTCFVNS